MTALELHFLGDFEVVRDGKPLPLPPSKKTRALLAYLSLNPRLIALEPVEVAPPRRRRRQVENHR
jgi:DNA-binding SARP family transcriptional activator